ncbi:hypothetical protein C8R43DRAFT_958412 [Mycena crocata]|nr:hypothetical protein C8R43DRAFT_958412 [Mycena crocata]
MSDSAGSEEQRAKEFLEEITNTGFQKKANKKRQATHPLILAWHPRDPTSCESRVRIAREIDCVVATRKAEVAQRRIRAQKLNDSLKENLKPVFRFLRSARRTDTERFNFPCEPKDLLEIIKSTQKGLEQVEDMLMASTDLDVTENESNNGGSGNSDSENERTRVEG